MTQKELIDEAKRHLAILTKCGSDIREIKEVALGLVVAFDASDNQFIYYFRNDILYYKLDQNDHVYAGDQRFEPAPYEPKIQGFICGIKQPKNWNEAVKQAEERLANCGHYSIICFTKPRSVK